MKEKIWKKKKSYLLSLKFWLRGVMHTVDPNFSNFVIEYLNEIEKELENTLACFSGAQMGSYQARQWRSKISWRNPFKVS